MGRKERQKKIADAQRAALVALVDRIDVRAVMKSNNGLSFTHRLSAELQSLPPRKPGPKADFNAVCEQYLISMKYSIMEMMPAMIAEIAGAIAEETGSKRFADVSAAIERRYGITRPAYRS